MLQQCLRPLAAAIKRKSNWFSSNSCYIISEISMFIHNRQTNYITYKFKQLQTEKTQLFWYAELLRHTNQTGLHTSMNQFRQLFHLCIKLMFYKPSLQLSVDLYLYRYIYISHSNPLWLIICLVCIKRLWNALFINISQPSTILPHTGCQLQWRTDDGVVCVVR